MGVWVYECMSVWRIGGLVDGGMSACVFCCLEQRRLRVSVYVGLG